MLVITLNRSDVSQIVHMFRCFFLRSIITFNRSDVSIGRVSTPEPRWD